MINQASVVLSGHKTTVLPSEHRWENRSFFWSVPLQRPIGAAPKLETLWKVWSHPRRMHHCHLERSCCLLLREHPVGAAKSRLAPKSLPNAGTGIWFLEAFIEHLLPTRWKCDGMKNLTLFLDKGRKYIFKALSITSHTLLWFQTNCIVICGPPPHPSALHSP